MKKIAFCFPGQGSQLPGMGKEIANSVPSAASVYEEANEAAGFDVSAACFTGSIEDLLDTRIQQPALVATSLACLRAIEEKGLYPSAVVGHSVGEYAALAACGVIDISSAIKLVRERGIAMAQVAKDHPGSMAAIIGGDDEQIKQLCSIDDTLTPANQNAPGQIIISGETNAIHQAIHQAKTIGIKRVMKLNVSGAFHSPLMEPAREELAAAIEKTTFSTPTCPIYQNVSTTAVTDPAEIKKNLLFQLTAPVKWTQSVENMLKDGATEFIEVVPGKVLQGLVKKVDRQATTSSATI